MTSDVVVMTSGKVVIMPDVVVTMSDSNDDGDGDAGHSPKSVAISGDKKSGLSLLTLSSL